MFEILWNLRDALNAGSELKNPATWKKSSIAIKSIVTLLTIVITVTPSLRGLVSDEQILQISTTVFTLVTVYSNYISIATTKKLGMK
jgi:hypothetical protein